MKLGKTTKYLVELLAARTLNQNLFLSSTMIYKWIQQIHYGKLFNNEVQLVPTTHQRDLLKLFCYIIRHIVNLLLYRNFVFIGFIYIYKMSLELLLSCFYYKNKSNSFLSTRLLIPYDCRYLNLSDFILIYFHSKIIITFKGN